MDKIKGKAYSIGDGESYWIAITFRVPPRWNEFLDLMYRTAREGVLDLRAFIRKILGHENITITRKVFPDDPVSATEVPFGWYYLDEYHDGPGRPFQHRAWYKINRMGRILITVHGGLDI